MAVHLLPASEMCRGGARGVATANCPDTPNEKDRPVANDCQTCEFILPNNECHRYPPVVVLEGANIRAAWPVVSADDWCGEYQAGGVAGSITLTSIVPNTLPSGSSPTTVDLYGTGFDTTCNVTIDGTTRASFFIDDTHLQYTARPDLQTGPATVQVAVVGAAGTSNSLPFSFT